MQKKNPREKLIDAIDDIAIIGLATIGLLLLIIGIAIEHIIEKIESVLS